MLLSLQILQNLFATPSRKKKKEEPKGDRFLQSFVLEQILTPSALIDNPNDSSDDIDLDIDDVDDGVAEDLGGDDSEDITSPDAPPPPISTDEYDVSPWIVPDKLENPGVFVVGETGEVGVDFLFDGGAYQGEIAIFSLEGMDDIEVGSEEFIRIAAERSLSDSPLGHVVIQDVTEGAKFSNSSYWEPNFNSGDYQGVETVTMNSGDRFAVMLVPNGSVEEVYNNPAIGGSKTPLFSLDSANPEDGLYLTRMADVTGDGNTFAMEDWRLDANSDRDYNDIVFQVRGARGDAPLMDEMVNPARDWRNDDFGQALISYARAYTDGTDYDALDTDFATSDQPLVGIIDTGFSGDNPDIDYSRIVSGSDFIDGDRDPFLAAGEGNEHGTHVLGIIGATQDNGLGIDGINDDAPIWLGRAVGSGRWSDSLIEFVDAAKESGQPNAVVNLSMDLTQIDAEGNVTTRYELTPGERAAIEYARQNDVLVVVSAGNDNGVMSALGQASQEFDNIITVGASDGTERAEYSSYGYGLDLMAEGGTAENGVLSTTGDGVGMMAGSSIAAAKVTGAASQVWAANPELSFTQVKQILKDTATDLNTPNWDTETGSGLLNIAAAVSLAKATKPEAHYSPSSLIPETWSGEGKVTPGDRAVNFIYPIQNESFSGTVAPITAQYGNGVAYRRSPRLDDRVGQYMAAVSNSHLNFDAWTYGEGVSDWWLGRRDELWYRVAGTDYWVPSAYINGYPGSSPSVLKPSNTSNSDPDPAPTNPSLTNPILSTQGAGYFTARPQYYTSGNIFALSMYGSSLVSGRGYTEGNCTWYAHGRLLELGGNRTALQSMNGNANEWHTQISNGTQIVSSPQVGDIAQWTSNGANHVAVVEKVNGDGTIVISESHWKSEYSGSTYLGRHNGTLHNVRTISASNPDRFLRVPGVQVQDGTPANTAGTFTGRVIATIGANLRDDPTTASAKVGSANYGAVLTFDKVATGEFISYPGLGTATDQWYRIAGTDNWISAAIVNGSPGSSLDARPAKPGEEIQYMIKPGDTLWDIARQYLGDGRRWTEIKKPDGSSFTSEEARRLQIGQSVYIPVKYEEQPQDSNSNGSEDENRPGDENGNEPNSLDDSITLQFELDDAGLWGSGAQGIYEGGDWRFDNIGFKEPFGIGEAWLNMKGGVSAYFSSGTFDVKLPGAFDFGLDDNLFTVSSNIGEGDTLFSSYLGAGLGIDFELGTGIGINNDVPIIGGSNLNFKTGLELDGADVLLGALVPTVAKFVDIDTGINIVDRQFDQGKLDGEDNLGVKMSLTDLLLKDKKMGGIKVDDLLSLDLGAYLNQHSSLELTGFQFDHDNDDKADFEVAIGGSESVLVPNGLTNFRVQPIAKLTTTFSFKIIGEAAVSFQNAIDSLIPDNTPQWIQELIKVNPGGVTLEPQFTFQVNQFDFKPFELSNVWLDFKE
ncbi:S8 family serine peptidase [Spirulina sp. 06S082]|uniref:S8 family serine peptidase n=1 Tax=Spirulina sp. 06S082 TaxID=3110248 RepID=UPI002B212406|nr:S8 family serine peptidase [Spirulina sp. 06S082]MEA5469069.1 S8 family serine peptidase [Spirulina sp. 06S082]